MRQSNENIRIEICQLATIQERGCEGLIQKLTQNSGTSVRTALQKKKKKNCQQRNFVFPSVME